MNIYLGKQAEEMLHNDRIPLNSIGVCKSRYGWGYWYYDDHIFDSGIELTEKEALDKAKLNFTSQADRL